MGHVEDRRAELPADVDDLELQRLAELPVEGAERLVHEQQPRLEDDGPGEGDPLLLAARQLARIAVAEVVELDERQRVGDPALDLGPRGRRRIWSGKAMFWAAVMCGNSA